MIDDELFQVDVVLEIVVHDNMIYIVKKNVQGVNKYFLEKEVATDCDRWRFQFRKSQQQEDDNRSTIFLVGSNLRWFFGLDTIL